MEDIDKFLSFEVDDDYCYGCGDGSGDGYGPGDSFGHGYGSGNHFSDGSGNHFSDGSGGGYGYGCGCQNGSGHSSNNELIIRINSIKKFNNHLVSKIDNILTIIENIHGNYAKG